MAQGFPNQRVGVNISAGGSIATTGTVVFSNSNGVSFGMQASASSSVVTASYAGAQAIIAGASTISNGTLSFADSNGVSFGFNGSTITASLPRVSYYEPFDFDASFSMVPASSTLNMSIQRIAVPLHVVATELDILGALSVAAGTNNTYSLSVGIYTIGGSTASLASSGTRSATFNAGAAYSSFSGTRWRSIALATWSVTPGDYLIAFVGSMGTTGATTGQMTFFGQSSISVNASEGSTVNFTKYFGDGLFSTGTGALPSSIHQSDIVQTGASPLGQPSFRLIGTN